MPLPATSHNLFERTWRSTCPIRPRHSVLRRWTGLALLGLLCALIVGYAYVTDADRVRRQAEDFLQRLVGGPAQVQAASLSLFEGLRLEGVTIRAPSSEAGERPDSVLFTARSVRIDYNPLDLLLGKISAQRVVAVDPHVRLTEDVDLGTWNFQRLERRRRPTTEAEDAFTPPEELPEILLRNAQVDYARLVLGELVPRGSVGIEAQLRPTAGPDENADDGAYRFAVQTRGLSRSQGHAGPRASGLIDLHQAQLEARLDDVDFGALLDILPRAAAEWWRQHGISGQLDVPQLTLDWDEKVTILAPDGTAERVPKFRAVVRLDQARMQGLPEEWLPAEEVQVRRGVAEALSRWAPQIKSPWVRNVVAGYAEQAQLRPLALSNVSGSFVFTHTGLRINGLVGEFEGNRLRMDGIVDGYTPDAAISLVVQNAGGTLQLPENVPYITSLPRQVREVYERFLPIGECRLRLELHRPAATPGGRPPRPLVTGFVDVLDGTFTLDRFPYPVRNARGRLILRYDRETQQDQLVIEDLHGVGLAGGPNENAPITVNGVVGPLTSVAGFDITVAGKDVSNEQVLIDALPEAARQTIANFDPAYHGRGAGLDGGPPPQMSFRGDFQAHVTRPAGPRQRWGFRVDLALKDVDGAFAGFPYPLKDASAEVAVLPDHVQIIGAEMRRDVPARDGRPVAEGTGADTGDLHFRGRVDWGPRPGDPTDLARRPLRVDLSVSARNLPTDAALLGALPPESVERLSALGVGGFADVSARVFTDDQDALSWDVSLDVHSGRFWPETGTFSLSEAEGRVRILPDRVELTNLTGRRGEGTVTIDGSIELNEGGLTDATLTATRVMLDASIYDLLPPAAKDAWNWLRPSGETDAIIKYRGPTSVLLDDGADPSQSEQLVNAAPEFDVVLQPQGARATPQAFPYELINIYGTLRIIPGRIELQNITAQHVSIEGQPPAGLMLSGVGELGTGPGGGDVWNLSPHLTEAPLDEALLSALPDGLAETLQSLKTTGVFSADFDLLRIETLGASEPATRPAVGAATAAAPALNAAFDVKVTAVGASADVGVPLSEVNGMIHLMGTYEAGELREVSGSFDGEKFAVRGRAGTNLRGTFAMPAGTRLLSVENLSAQVADGELAGSLGLRFGETDADPTSYAVEMAVREADVRKLVGEQQGTAADFSGRMTARLDVEGKFGDASSRRGRGEVIVEGQKLYDLPLVLGLLQVTNLALPLSEPFREATTSFTLDGQRVVFDHITLKAADMEMGGQGTLDFETQKVDLSFTTSNNGWAKIPLVGDLVGMARNELLRISIRGTLQSPEVSGRTLPTITSTIDEVFRRE